MLNDKKVTELKKSSTFLFFSFYWKFVSVVIQPFRLTMCEYGSKCKLKKSQDYVKWKEKKEQRKREREWNGKEAHIFSLWRKFISFCVCFRSLQPALKEMTLKFVLCHHFYYTKIIISWRCSSLCFIFIVVICCSQISFEKAFASLSISLSAAAITSDMCRIAGLVWTTTSSRSVGLSLYVCVCV